MTYQRVTLSFPTKFEERSLMGCEVASTFTMAFVGPLGARVEAFSNLLGFTGGHIDVGSSGRSIGAGMRLICYANDTAACGCKLNDNSHRVQP